MPSLNLYHIPPLFVAAAFSLGGLTPLSHPAGALLAYGLPARVADSPAAHPAIQVNGSRTTVLGAALCMFYARGQLESVDLLLGLCAWMGVADFWILWRQGVTRKAVYRGIYGLAIGVWGWMGLTTRFAKA